MVTRVYLCVCLPAVVCPHYCTDADVTCGSRRECPLVVHYLADLQSVHGLRCYGNTTRTPNVSEYVLVLPRCLVCSVRGAGSAVGLLCACVPIKFSNEMTCDLDIRYLVHLALSRLQEENFHFSAEGEIEFEKTNSDNVEEEQT